MQLTTPVLLQPLEPAIDYNSSMVFLGSCFTENIGHKMAYYGFQTCVNPFGIVFNPHSLMVLLERSLSGKLFSVHDVTTHFSYLTHSDLNGNSIEQVVKNLNTAGQELAHQIKTASHVFITLGTAWVYEHVEQQLIVANCHQQPQKLFDKKLLSIAQIKASLEKICELIASSNDKAQIIFTLSPVRHIKDGFTENQRSKARLFEAIQTMVDEQKASYFPAYEIVMDELRDYRFYGRDMIHLSDLGIELVWERFRESVISNNTAATMNAVKKYRKLAAHKPTDTAAHANQVATSKSALLKNHPQIRL